MFRRSDLELIRDVDPLLQRQVRNFRSARMMTTSPICAAFVTSAFLNIEVVCRVEQMSSDVGGGGEVTTPE